MAGQKEQAALIREVEKRVLAAKTEPAIRQAARDQAILVIFSEHWFEG